jgi:tetratricopeptide (TPR) repeat protein
MNAAFNAAVTLLVALASASFCEDAPAEAPSAWSSSTVLGPNALLADGAMALLNRQWEKGIQLTLMGLNDNVSNADRAAGLANLCAGYIATRQYELALESCDRSIAIAGTNWRAWQNRAAANLALGRIDDSMRDIQRGLAINPDSAELQETLAIARERERLHKQQLRDLVES